MQSLVSNLAPRLPHKNAGVPIYGDAIRVIVADGAAEFREATCELLQAFFDVEICGKAKDGFEALQLAVAFAPDLLIMDAGLPGLSGMEAASLIARACPTTHILMMSGNEAPKLRECSFAAGAHGFTSKKELAILFTDLCSPAS